MSKIKIENLVKEHGPNTILKGLNLTINSGEFVVFVGPSGCGKSTTLRLIAGLDNITSGNISIGDKVVNDIPPRDRNIAMVFQNYALYPHMSVYENMAFSLRMRKATDDDIQKRVNEAAKLLGLEAMLQRRPNQLSGGQRQRVAMGRAIVRDPSVFLFDEPLSNLDANLRNQMRAEIKKLHERLKTTTIYVTHDQVEAMTLADRIVLLRAGVIEQMGTPEELYNNPANCFVGAFLGNPPMNFIKAKVVDSKIMAGTTQIANVSDFPSLNNSKTSDLIVGIRPEKLYHNYEGTQGNYLKGKLDLVEVLGSTTLVHLILPDGQKVIARSNETKHAPHSELTVGFNAKDAHLFDAQTEKKI